MFLSAWLWGLFPYFQARGNIFGNGKRITGRGKIKMAAVITGYLPVSFLVFKFDSFAYLFKLEAKILYLIFKGFIRLRRLNQKQKYRGQQNRS